MIQLLGDFLVMNYRVIRAGNSGWRFGENHRLLWQFFRSIQGSCRLGHVFRIIEANSENVFSRFGNGGKNMDLFLWNYAVGQLVGIGVHQQKVELHSHIKTKIDQTQHGMRNRKGNGFAKGLGIQNLALVQNSQPGAGNRCFVSEEVHGAK